MAHMILYCAETPDLKLGPGTVTAFDIPGNDVQRDVIMFSAGFAEFDTDKFPDWERWVKHPGSPYIDILGAQTDLVELGSGFACPVCANTRTPREFSSKQKLSGHMLTHRRKGEA